MPTCKPWDTDHSDWVCPDSNNCTLPGREGLDLDDRSLDDSVSLISIESPQPATTRILYQTNNGHGPLLARNYDAESPVDDLRNAWIREQQTLPTGPIGPAVVDEPPPPPIVSAPSPPPATLSPPSSTTSTTPSNGPEPPPVPRPRHNKTTGHRCERCLRGKKKCSGGLPVCNSCAESGKECLWPPYPMTVEALTNKFKAGGGVCRVAGPGYPAEKAPESAS